MTKNVDPDLADRLRAESETTRDQPYPEKASYLRPNRDRSKVYSVRLSPEEYAQVQQVADQRHLPPATLVRAWILERLEHEQSA